LSTNHEQGRICGTLSTYTSINPPVPKSNTTQV
jgi:hypothetical protein